MYLARTVGGEIVSVDSMQIYRGMDIGTAKPTAEEMTEVPHHLVDIADPADAFSVSEFQVAGRAALSAIASEGSHAIICGGSGLHFRSLVDPLEFPPTDDELRTVLESCEPADLIEELLTADPDAGSVVDLANPRRVLRAVEIHRLTGDTPTMRAGRDEAADVREYVPSTPFAALGVDPGDGLASRVAGRLDAMIASGWVEEAARLAGTLGTTAALAVGYRELAEVAAGRLALDEAKQQILNATLALAKRQRTFFRRDPRIRWLTWHDDAAATAAEADAVLEEAGAWTS